MKNSYRFRTTKSRTVFSEIVRPILAGFAIGAILMGLYFGGKAAGREEILRSCMWTDSCGTIYIDAPSGVTAHENLAAAFYRRK